MHRYIIMYDCYWSSNYPVQHTYGEFPLYAENDLKVIYYIKNKFLNFIINGENDIFEIKIGV